MRGQSNRTGALTTAVTDRAAPERRWPRERRLPSVVRAVAVLLGLLVSLITLTGTAAAATIQVTTSVDENGTNPAACSLREALTAANTNAAFGGCPAGDPDGTATDQITFASATDGVPIVLGGAELSVSSRVAIVGNGVTQTAVSGNNTSRVFNVTAGPSSISSLTIRNGNPGSGSDGGGILNTAVLTVTNSTLSSNSADQGGGIFNNVGGALIVTNSTLSNNSASLAGGGIRHVSGGNLTVTNSTLSNNTAANDGGGIFSTGALTVVNSTLSGNSAGQGGGINQNGGSVRVSSSTLSGNSATAGGGGIRVSGSTVRLRATILDTGPSGANCSGSSFLSLGSNLSDDNSCFFGATGDANNVATLNLGPLADNGGPTQTHALLANSAAIDAVQGSCTSDGTGGGTAIASISAGWSGRAAAPATSVRSRARPSPQEHSSSAPRPSASARLAQRHPSP